MIQRMRQLAVQGANGTMSAQDRQSLMDEISQLQNEIDRISNDTEYNTRGLINGELSRRTYTDAPGIRSTYISDAVTAGTYELSVAAEATYSELSSNPIDVPVTGIEVDGTITINGENVAIEKGETLDEVLDKIKSVADLSDISVNCDGTNITFKSDILGSNYPININCTKELAEKLGLEMQMSAQGTDAIVTPTLTANNTFKFPDSTTVEVDGNNITLSASGGFEMRVVIDEGSLPAPIPPATESKIKVTALDIGTMVIQMGANEGQVMDINVPEVSCAAMGIDKLNLHTEAGCDRAIGMCDDALKYISSVRSKLGAYANRMEHAVNSLNVTTENMTAALSRIEDVDMAKEMTTFTSQNVITQAANSMLAQANQMPEKVLQLLQ
jgi:flagellin